MHCFRTGVEKGMKLCTTVQEGCGYKDTLPAHDYFAPSAKYFTVCITYQPPLVFSVHFLSCHMILCVFLFLSFFLSFFLFFFLIPNRYLKISFIYLSCLVISPLTIGKSFIHCLNISPFLFILAHVLMLYISTSLNMLCRFYLHCSEIFVYHNISFIILYSFQTTIHLFVVSINFPF